MAGRKGASGGRRPGAGRKPTREKFATRIAAAEKRIADGLPDLVDRLFELSEGVWLEEITPQGVRKVFQRPPDFKATSYLMDRVMGKPTQTVEADVTSGGEPFKVYAGVNIEEV